MKVVIVHYHLRPGGVTSVIRQQIAVLAELMPDIAISLLVGESDPSFNTLPCTITADPVLDYFVPQTREEAEQREVQIIKLLAAQIGDCETIFHFHNSTLGKNPSLSGAIHSLADRNVKIVQFCHDFSEDRPINQQINEQYAEWCRTPVEEFLYPDHFRIFYCTINSFDKARIQKRNFRKSSVHLIPSPVQKPALSVRERGEIAALLDLSPSKEWWFYPVRGIERKNCGEFILLALLDEGRREWLLARKPANQSEIPLYESWVELARELAVPVHFDVVETAAFGDLMNASDRIITTSVREGFGMAYLEPWMAGKAVVGREIPMVVDDMRRAGVVMDFLYRELLVPVDGAWVDFALLSSDQQKAVVRSAAEDSSVRELIRSKGDWKNRIYAAVTRDLIWYNAQVIDREFSAHAFGERLLALYDFEH